MEQQPPSFYTVEQIARMLQVSEDTVTNFLKRKKNRLPSYKVGRQYRILVEDFNKWLQEQQYRDKDEE